MFDRGTKVLLTGASGFLGRYVTKEIEKAGARVIPISRATGHDLTLEGNALRAMETHPDIIVHLAARVGGIIANMDSPGTFFRDNLKMGVNMIEACAKHGFRIVIVGTICSYPKHCPVPFKEEDFWNGFPEETNAPYGIAKKALLTMCQAYRKEFGLKFGYVCPTNLYGPFDNFDDHSSHVIPAMIKKFMKAKEDKTLEMTLFGTGKVTRSFLYAQDAAEAVMVAAAGLDYNDVVNLPGCPEISMKNLATLIARLVGYEGKINWDTSKPDGQPRRFIAGGRAKELLGWEPVTPLEGGIMTTVNWYQSTLVNGGP